MSGTKRPKTPDKFRSWKRPDRIYLVKCKTFAFTVYMSTSGDAFKGSALDTGAQRTVIGLRQAKAYCREHKVEFRPRNAGARFVFGDRACPSLGEIYIIIPTPTGLKQIRAHVVGADVPLLIGVNTLDKYGWNVLTVENALHSVKEGWHLPIQRQDGHVFLTWEPLFGIIYSKTQLQRLHYHFMHPSAGKLFNLLNRATPQKLTAATKQILEQISRACHVCQVYSSKPLTFQVRMPDEVVFNKEVRLGRMFINNKPILHIIDVGTNFSAARFLTRQDAETIWNTFLYTSVTMYVGYPESMLTDQGSAFVSELWKGNCSAAEIKLRHTGVTSHNSVGAGETYHAIIRHIFNKLSLEHPNISDELKLAITVKAVNDTAGPNGLVPSLLLFVVIPRIPEYY